MKLFKTCSHKKQYVRANQAPFMNKKINKEIIRSEKKNFFSNVNTSDITYNKTFWKTVRPHFTTKIKTKSKSILFKKRLTPR